MYENVFMYDVCVCMHARLYSADLFRSPEAIPPMCMYVHAHVCIPGTICIHADLIAHVRGYVFYVVYTQLPRQPTAVILMCVHIYTHTCIHMNTPNSLRSGLMDSNRYIRTCMHTYIHTYINK